jgi:hypothetical protein
MANWDIVVVEPAEPGITHPTDEDLQAVTTDYDDEASARQAYVEKLKAAAERRHTAVQLRCDGRILEQWPDPAQ